VNQKTLDGSAGLVCNAGMFMKSFTSLSVGLLGLTWVAAVPCQAETVHYLPVPNSSKVRMDGDSTVHKWNAETDVIGGSLELEADFPGNASSAVVTPKVDVKIPVRSLKSSGGNRMDAVMQEHMKFTDHKTIEYRVLELAPKAGSAGQYDAKGALTVAGVTKTNTMAVTIEKVEGTKLKVTGKTALKMTDFGISPPAPDIGLGLIKTSDDVQLTFSWITAPKAS
jgi:polyisoprenoid-binding protein YceI